MREEKKQRTKADIAQDLQMLGVKSGDIVMLHASYKALGDLSGGPNTLIDALTETLSPKGGIVMFVSWAESTYDAFAQGNSLNDVQRENWPAFDPKTASVRKTHAGAIGACLAQRLDSVRSLNPDRSLVATGAAIPLIEDHILNHGFGPNSPLEKLYKAGGKTLNIGAPLSTATILHYAEYLTDVPDKQYVNYEIPILENGQKFWHSIEQMNRDAFVEQAANLEMDYIEQTIRDYIKTGQHKEGLVGDAQSYLFEMQDLVPFAVQYFKEQFG